MADGEESRGLYPKYRVVKISDGDVEGSIRGEVSANGYEAYAVFEELTEPFFVMKFSDKAAQDALFVYAKSVKKTHPKVASDIQVLLEQTIAEQEGLADG